MYAASGILCPSVISWLPCLSNWFTMLLCGWIPFLLKVVYHSTTSPRSLMTGVPLDYKKHCPLHLGSYAQTHEEPDPTNTLNTRTVGAICLGPTDNLQGSQKFFSLQSGKLITHRTWTALPMPQEVIDRVNAIGMSQDQPKLLTFYNWKGELVSGDPQCWWVWSPAWWAPGNTQ